MQQNDEQSDGLSDASIDKVGHETRAQTAPSAQATESVSDDTEVTEFVPSSDDPMGTRIIYVVVAMVVLMFIIALFFLFEVARRRPA